MVKLRGNRFGIDRTPDEILDLLAGIADQYGYTSPKKNLYYVWDITTIRQIDWFSPRSIRHFIGTCLREKLPQLYQSNCGADFLRIKNHYLAFYLKDQILIKLFLDSESQLKHVEGVNSLNRFEFKNLKAPPIVNSSLEPIPHTVECFVPGDNYQVLPLELSRELLMELAEFHFDQGKPAVVELTNEERDQIIAGLKKLGFHQHEIKQLQGYLEKSSWHVLEGETHGDISGGNLIRGKDAVYLTDWEFFDRGPVARDLVKLCLDGDESLRHATVNVYNQKWKSSDFRETCDDIHSSLMFYIQRLLLGLYASTSDQFTRVFRDRNQVEKRISLMENKIKTALLSLLNIY